jgi:FMN phosphatase YigB (HAD superfamily)
MFQFAFGLAASRILRTRLYFEGAPKLLPYFDLGAYTAFPNRAARTVLARLRSFEQVEVDNDQDPDQVVAEVADWRHYGGYFESERYFRAAANEIRELYRPRAEFLERFHSKYAQLVEEDYICVQVRRTDPVVQTPTVYYDAVRPKLEGLGERPLIVVSDNPDAAEAELGHWPGVKVERNDAITDMLLLVHARTLVLPASSFGWWAAWLNGREDKEVFVPQAWLGWERGAEWPRGIIVGGWNRVPWG